MMLECYIKSLTKNIEENNICDTHFCLLIELSGIRSDKVIMSLRDHLVGGMSKNHACKKNDVSLSYFSLSLKKLLHTHNILKLISKYYSCE
ncbi:PbsX family transcriptional regulator [Escherichia coli]|uniref:PapB/FocB family fimbrial expression transcriptional regulator n=2 Tax=Escherichia coli TaxID=562 RepID=UPI0013025C72|nr:PapB/FocB family fimbrial expression transcriptional regulator [Escherichia coli]KAE9787737.1 PbsX family transcriptional regulator [Escherichia coli]MWN30679.1 PbsX family transcriptional regulator [Escherichia coli]MWN46410.1 PbsX family transcriptional regulator [Escherichia coli]MWN51242.1 PbsX family transcriptional regulator [Escherichia coli]MWN65149.1 PbsX family transcriptional regulator [Escherichia coli]